MFSIVLNIIGFIQSLFLGSLLLVSTKHKNGNDQVAGILMLVFAIPIFNSIRILLWGPRFLIGYELLSNYSLLLVGPLLFIYTKNRISNSRLSRTDGYHFLPFLILFPLQLLCLSFLEKSITDVIEFVLVMVLLLSMTIYQVLSIRLVFLHKKVIENSFLFTIFGFALVWHINLLFQLTYFLDETKEQYRIFATLILSFLILVLCYSHWFELIKKLTRNKSKVNINQQKIKQILSKIQSEMETNQPYLNNDFTLQKLASEIGEPSSYISFVINKKMNMSFPKFIAQLRVKEFVRKAQQSDYQHLSIQGLSEEVGFKSPSTFNKAFKENMNTLPSTFMNSIKKG